MATFTLAEVKRMTNENDREFIATHAHPVLRDHANYIFRCRVEATGDRLEWEQMWGKMITENVYKLCCIPFFVYGLSLEDVIKIDANGNAEILEKSLNATIRIWIAEADHRKKAAFVETALELCDQAENHSTDLIALSVCKERFARLVTFLERESAPAGVTFEVANR
jgi:hypothetical protein